MKTSAETKDLFTALAKAQSQMTGAVRDAQNPHFKSDYASLQSCWEACRAPLSANGLAVIQTLFSTDAKVGVTTILGHTSGQWIEDSLLLSPRDLSPQAMGSAITYGRRYSLMAIVGIAPADDDGNSASVVVTLPQANKVAATTPPAAGQCALCGTALQITKAGDAYTCPNWKDRANGAHTYSKLGQQAKAPVPQVLSSSVSTTITNAEPDHLLSFTEDQIPF